MPYKEKSHYDEFQRITNMAQKSGISKYVIDDAMIYHKKISEQKTFRGLNRDGIIAASIYISCRINENPRTAKEIAGILNIRGISDYVRVSELKKQAVKKLIDSVDHSQVLDFL